jgi:molecular chaperone DnaJ
MQRDYYEVLGVGRSCDVAELKSAFRKLAMEHHPDRNGGCEEASGRFKEINEAYSVLSDPNKRATYDRFGHAGLNGAGGGAGGAGFTDVHDIFNEVFGQAFGDMFGGGRQGRSGPARGQDLRYDLEISLEQAYAGADVEIAVPAALTCEACTGSGCAPGSSPTTCNTCHGAGRVRASQGFFAIERTCPRCGGFGKLVLDPCRECRGAGQIRRERTLQVRIPAGVDDGSRIRLAGEGDAGAQKGPRGDLYIFVSVKPHELFERDGLDLLCTMPVPMATAVLGGEIEAPCLLGGENCDGNCKIKVRVPEGAQTGKTVRLKGRGMPSLRSRDRGDLVVELFVETPTRLTPRQKELMREFAGACGEHQHPQSAGFFKKARRFWDGITTGEARA